MSIVEQKNLTVTYDEINNTIAAVELYQSEDELRHSRKIQLHGIVKNIQASFLTQVIFFVSNSFADGKLSDYVAIRGELKENG